MTPEARFGDQVALITAVSSGIGRATADIIGGEGGIVGGVDRDQAWLDAAMLAVRSAGGRTFARRADALDPGRSAPWWAALSVSSDASTF